MTIDLHVYADESGIEGDSLYCIVAGFVGSPRWWDKFNADWRTIINAAPNDVEEFHAKDFFERNHAAKKNSERTPFRSWPGASAFLTTLVDVIVRYRGKIKPVACALNVADFFSFTWGERQYFTGGMWNRERGRFTTSGAPSRVYPLPLHGCIGDALTHAHPDDCKVHFLFDEQRVLKAGVIQTIAEVRKAGLFDQPIHEKVGTIRFDDSKNWPGIQAGDMLAYLMQSNARRREKLSIEQRDALVAIMGGDRWKWGVYDRAKLHKHLLGKFDSDQLEQIRAVNSPAEIQRAKPVMPVRRRGRGGRRAYRPP